MQHTTAQAKRERPWVRALVLGAAVTSVALSLATIVLGRLTPANGVYLYDYARSDLVVGGVFPAVGALVLVRQPRNRCGWVLLSGGLLSVSAFSHQWAYDGGAEPGSLPGLPVATWLAAWTFMPYWFQSTLLPVLFPDGGAPSRRWRPFVAAVLVVAAIGTVAAMFKPDADVEGLGLANPLGIGASSTKATWIAVQYGAVSILFLVATPIAIVGLLYRQRRAVGRARAQLQWLLFGFLSFFILSLAALASGPAEDAVSVLALLVIPASVAVAVVRHGLLDIEVVINRTILYAVLTGASIAAYAGLVAAAGTWAGGAQSRGPAIAAVVVASAALVRGRMQRLVDRWLFGLRRDPYAVVDRVGARVADARGPVDAIAGLVTSLRDALSLPFAELETGEAGGVSFSSGQPTAEVEELPLAAGGRHVGVLRIGHRHRGEQFRPEERSALTDVARRASSLIHSAAMAADLQRSREEIVLAREEERRRLRRDLHDGLGPELAGMALQLEALAARLPIDPDLAARAGRLGDRLQQAVSEVRRVVDGMRPAAVDELGLAEAIRQLVAGAGEMAVVVDVPPSLGELPAAVEVAAYRIAAEAFTNAVRHSGASRCRVYAGRQESWLVVQVVDDGRGFGTEATAGVGLESLHDRAAEVGGSVEIVSTPGTGTSVAARLPLEVG